MEGSGGAYLDFLTWVGGQKPWGPEESLMGVGIGQASIPSRARGLQDPEDSHPGASASPLQRGAPPLLFPGGHGCALPQSSAQTLAMEVVKSWDTDGFLSKHYQAHVQGEVLWETAGLPGVLGGLRRKDRYNARPRPFLCPCS